jgi:hypothetical protein
MAARDEDRDARIFGGPRKHYRRTYSVSEVRTGAVLVAALVAIALWVRWRGGQPDPELTNTSLSLARRTPAQADRGPMPPALAPDGWTEERPQVFDPDGLYIKIDGREAYYKSFGFERLHCLTLVAGSRTIDLELYNLGKALNALGAAAGELPAGAAPEMRDGGLWLIDKNALYLARGKYYLRAIGSADDPPIHAALEHVRAKFVAALESGKLPWSYGLFVRLGVPPSKVSYYAENAFSFGFAQAVHVGLLVDGDTELFVSLQKDEAAARALAGRYSKGFAEYGDASGAREGVSFIKDRYLSRVSAAGASGRVVFGVRGAESESAAFDLYRKLQGALQTVTVFD